MIGGSRLDGVDVEQASQCLRDLGEKRIIREIVRPLFNPNGDADSVGDDCAIVRLGSGPGLCASTDRVPTDLVSFRLGILDHAGLGRYLAVLNLSDIAAMGAQPAGLLLNLGLPSDMLVDNLKSLLQGVDEVCLSHDCRVIGGDLSSAFELCLSATSLGILDPAHALRRNAAQPGDKIYCSDKLGLTATAFAYFLTAKPAGIHLTAASEQTLMDCFRKVRPRFDVSSMLVASGRRASAMDNTDGAGQTFLELAEASGTAFVLRASSFPLHSITLDLAELLSLDAVDLALSAGADFQILGAVEPTLFDEQLAPEIFAVGEVREGDGLFLERPGRAAERYAPQGWNYYSAVERAHLPDARVP